MRPVAFICALILGACSSGDKGVDAGATAPPAPAARKDGRLRIEDAFVPVAPLVIHEAKMDLFVACKQDVDAAKKAGQEAPLCYEPARRGQSAVTSIRVEYRLGMTTMAMRDLSVVHEGAHFLVERSGSIFQLMDLAYAVRRDGANRGDEIRIVAMGGKEQRGADAVTEPLVQALSALYPLAKVTTVDVGGGDP